MILHLQGQDGGGGQHRGRLQAGHHAPEADHRAEAGVSSILIIIIITIIIASSDLQLGS